MSSVESFYDLSAEHEWGRLERHRTEYAVTLRALAEYLPSPPARVVDIGGGPGRYSIALAQRGYQVTLVDLSKGLLEFARGKAAEADVRLESYIHANVLDLSSIPGESYDAALLMGPLYHLLKLEERRKAVAEVYRVLRPGGVLAASVVTRYANFRYAARADPEWLIREADAAGEILETGQDIGPFGAGVTEVYFTHPSELAPLMEGQGFQTLAMVGCEGLVSDIEDKINSLEGDLWEAWVALNYRVGKDPFVHGACYHLLYLGQR